MTPTTYRLVLTGLGNVGKGVLSILHREADTLRKRYGVQFLLTGAAELEGCVIDNNGLDIGLLLDTLNNRQPVSALPDIGKPGMKAVNLIGQAQADFLLEATPVNLQDAQPGLGIAKAALQIGIHVIFANKGPLAIAWHELAAMSDLGSGWGAEYNPAFKPANGIDICPKVRCSACVAGALPTINIGCRDLSGGRITRLEAVFNGTTQYILREMERGQSYDAALSDAQQRGIAETDPTLDVDGWDSAAKLVIAANAVLGQITPLSDVDVQGIRILDNAVVQQAATNDQRMVLVCLAEQVNDRYQLSVRPTPLPLDHPLCRLTPDEMGVVFYTQDVERLSVASSEPGPEPASAAMLRDVLDIIRSEIGL